MGKDVVKIYGDGEIWIDGLKKGKIYPDGEIYVIRILIQISVLVLFSLLFR